MARNARLLRNRGNGRWKRIARTGQVCVGRICSHLAGSLKIERHLEAEKSFLPGQEMVHMTFADEERGPRRGLHGLGRGQKEGRTPAGVVNPLGRC
jgi:hypothetical protein